MSVPPQNNVYPPPGHGQPPPPMYQPPPPGPQHVVVVAPGVVHQAGIAFRESPVSMNCPFCHAQIVTSTTCVTGTFAWVICGILLLLGFWLGCCLIPFCVNGCKDVIHTCPNCRQQVGKYNRM